jgi:hypothetical protein
MLEISIQTSYDFKEFSACSVWYHLKYLFSGVRFEIFRKTNSFIPESQKM